MSLVQRVNAAAPTYSVWDRFFNSEEVAANTENYKRSAEKQMAELTQWQAGLEDVYCKHLSPSSRYRRATARLTCRIWRHYSTYDFYRQNH
jgi:hypothetical protein